ncbi:MAG: aminotransferase class I/II-fold pyridoxal phosphate-dependent enzyme [Planctomycetota bacterium]
MRHDMEGQIGSQAQPKPLPSPGGEIERNSQAGAAWLPVWPPQWPEIRQSIDRCFESGDWGRYDSGITVELVGRLSRLADGRHCRLVSSGSLGIEIALRTAGVKPGDEVILCAYDYPGNFRAVESVGAKPVLVDVEEDRYSAAVTEIDRARSPAVKAVIVSHLYGLAADIEPIRQLCDDSGWKLIEDACQVPGMTIAGKTAGSWGDVGVLSFGGSKPLTAGRGGALLTADDAVIARLKSLLDRPSDATGMGPLQAAALLPQLDRLAECNRHRAQAIEWLREPLAKSQCLLPEAPRESTFYKLAFRVANRAPWLEEFSRRGLPVGVGYRSMHRCSDRRARKVSPLERSQALAESVCLLDHRALLTPEGDRNQLVAAMRGLDD